MAIFNTNEFLRKTFSKTIFGTDDTIWNYVNDFLSGDISREAFWALAKFKHPTHQISFHTEVALKCLSFKEAIEV